jgi:hypothetical protein
MNGVVVGGEQAPSIVVAIEEVSLMTTPAPPAGLTQLIAMFGIVGEASHRYDADDAANGVATLATDDDSAGRASPPAPPAPPAAGAGEDEDEDGNGDDDPRVAAAATATAAASLSKWEKNWRHTCRWP